jgi:hypothetical protein
MSSPCKENKQNLIEVDGLYYFFSFGAPKCVSCEVRVLQLRDVITDRIGIPNPDNMTISSYKFWLG